MVGRRRSAAARQERDAAIWRREAANLPSADAGRTLGLKDKAPSLPLLVHASITPLATCFTASFSTCALQLQNFAHEKSFAHMCFLPLPAAPHLRKRTCKITLSLHPASHAWRYTTFPFMALLQHRDEQTGQAVAGVADW